MESCIGEVLKGYFERLNKDFIPKKKLMVFVSSTFTDTLIERNIILEKILPQLKARARQHRVEVTFVDMRWGVRDENTLDHRTWIDCERELRRCYEESGGLFFLSLQSAKYGYLPIPRSMSLLNFNDRLLNLSSHTVSLSQEWYHLDANSVPPEYILKSLSSVNNAEYWQNILPTLREAFDEVIFWENLQNQFPLHIGHSVTEWETLTAVFYDNSLSRCFWTYRVFSPLPSKATDPKELYYDASEPGKSFNYLRHIEWMKTIFQDRIFEFSPIKYEDLVNKTDKWDNYIHLWEAKCSHLLNEELSKIVDKRTRWAEDGCGLGLKGSILEELLHHCKIAKEKSVQFERRDELVRTILSMIWTDNRSESTDKNKSYHSFIGLSLALVGHLNIMSDTFYIAIHITNSNLIRSI